MEVQARTTRLKPGADAPPSPNVPGLSVLRLNLMRIGYAIMGVGLAVVTWPLLADLRDMPLYEGVVTCLLVALVAAPTASAGDLSPEMRDVAVSCSVVIVVVAVIPWQYAWQRLTTDAGDPWR